MTIRKPRTVLALAVGLLVAVLALFAAALLHANSNDRGQAERRFADRARVSAALTESLFGLSSNQGAQQNKERYGDRKVDRAKLEQAKKQGQLQFMVILNDAGIPIAFSDGTPPGVLSHITSQPPIVKKVLGGQGFAVSDYEDLPGAPGVVEFATAFSTDFGRRVIVQGIGTQFLGLFLGGYLQRIPGAEKASAYVLDTKGRVLGTPVSGVPVGATPREPGLIKALADGAGFGKFDSRGTERAFASTNVGGTPWRVVITETTQNLYAGINSTVQWLIFLALALAGLAACIGLNRSLRAGDELQHAYARLEFSNDELERSNLELKRSNAELEQFASVASHDLQEPLRKVQTFGDQLERRFGEQIPDEAIDYLRRMRRAANRMSTLIEDLLRFSRVTTHARPPQPVDLVKVAREVTSDLEAPLHEAHGSVEIDGLPVVEADPLQMRQLLQNLIANGIKFHRPGEPPIVRVEGMPAPDPEHVSFTVTDNGIGFEPDYEERIFRVFERLHPRDVYEGTGIGLALCRKIVERHGGTITAEGRPDEGARFIVTLPARQATVDDAPESVLERDHERHAHV